VLNVASGSPCTRPHAGHYVGALAAIKEAVNATANPAAHLPHLATSLDNLADILGELGRQQEAAATAEEAVRVRTERRQSM
jgi:hypothetical protein